MSAATHIALVQCDVSDTQSRSERMKSVSALVQQAAHSGAQFVVLPELWPLGAFNVEGMRTATAHDFQDFLNLGANLARSHGIWLHAGSDIEVASPSGERFNTSVLFNPRGEIVCTYRKMHLWGGGEAALLGAGAGAQSTATPIGVAGITTCYELRFPELYRHLLNDDVTAFIVVAGWPVARIEHWRTLLRARAIENQAWVIGVNCVGTHAGVTMGGFSVVVNPRGEMVVEAAADEPCIVYADIDATTAVQWREKFRWLDDRREY